MTPAHGVDGVVHSQPDQGSGPDLSPTSVGLLVDVDATLAGDVVGRAVPPGALGATLNYSGDGRTTAIVDPMSDNFGINIGFGPKQPEAGQSFLGERLHASLPSTASAQVVRDSIAAALHEQYDDGLTDWDRLDLAIDIALVGKQQGSMWTVTETAGLEAGVPTSASAHEVKAVIVAALQKQFGNGFTVRDLNLWLE